MPHTLQLYMKINKAAFGLEGQRKVDYIYLIHLQKHLYFTTTYLIYHYMTGYVFKVHSENTTLSMLYNKTFLRLKNIHI